MLTAKRQTSDVGTREEEAVKLQSRHEQELMSSKAAVRCAVSSVRANSCHARVMPVILYKVARKPKGAARKQSPTHATAHAPERLQTCMILGDSPNLRSGKNAKIKTKVTLDEVGGDRILHHVCWDYWTYEAYLKKPTQVTHTLG